MSDRVFYSSRSGSYNETQCTTSGPRVVKTLCSRALIVRNIKWCLQRCAHVWSCHLPHYTRSAVWRRAVESLGTVDACPHILQVLMTLHACMSYRRMIALTWGVMETCARALGTCVPSCTDMSDMLFFMLETRGPQGAVGHMATSEPAPAGRRGPKK
jgi:hypothetical protein